MRNTHDTEAVKLRRELERMRYRGCKGGFIPRHRALLFSPCDPRKIGIALAIVVGMTMLWYALLGEVSRLWGGALDFCATVLAIGGPVSMMSYELGPVRFDVPYLFVPSFLPSSTLWWIGVIVTLGLVLVSLLIPRRYLPISYFLRITAFFQGSAQVFFAFWPDAFPYTAGGYIHTMLIAGLMMITLIPLVLGFTYYMFDFSVSRKLALTLLIMVHLAVMIPLQYVVHAFALYHLSLLFLPLLFFVFGLPLCIPVFIAFYSWGFSWKSRLHEQQVQWKARRRFV